MKKIVTGQGKFLFVVYCLVLTVTVTSHPQRSRLARDVDQQHQESLTYQGNPDQYVRDQGEALIDRSHDHQTIQHQDDTEHRSNLLSDPDSTEQLENFDHENTENAVDTLELGHTGQGETVEHLSHEEIEQTDTTAKSDHQVDVETEGGGEHVAPDVEIEHQASQHGAGEGSVSHTDVEHIHGRRNIDDGDMLFSNGEVALHWTTRSTTVREVEHHGQHVMIDSGIEIEQSSVAGAAESSSGQEIVDVGNITHNAQLHHGHSEELAGYHDNHENVHRALASSTRATTPDLQIDHAEGNKERNQDSQGEAAQGPAYFPSSLTPEPLPDVVETTSYIPVVEPIIGTTAKLVILPTPAQSNGNESEHEGMITQLDPVTTEESRPGENQDPESGTHETPLHGDHHHGNEETPEGHETELSNVTHSPLQEGKHDEETSVSHVSHETSVQPDVIEGIKPLKGDTHKEHELKVSSSYVSVTPLYSSAAQHHQSLTETLPTMDSQGTSSNDFLHSSFSSPSTAVFSETANPTDSTSIFSSAEHIEQTMSSSFSSEFFEPTTIYESSSLELSEPTASYRTSTDSFEFWPTTESDISMPEYSTSWADLEPTTMKMEIPDASEGPIIDQESVLPSSMWPSENTYTSTSSSMFESSSSSVPPNLHSLPSTGSSMNDVTTQVSSGHNVPTFTETAVTNSIGDHSIEAGQEVTYTTLFTISKTDDYSGETTTNISESVTQDTLPGSPEVPGHDHEPSEVPVSTTQRTTMLPFLTVTMTTKRKKITQTPKVTDKTDAVVPTTRSGSTPLLTPRTTTKQPVSQLPVYLQIQLRMSWHVFCDRKIHFIAKLQEIIRTEKQVTVDEEQFHITNTQQCDEMPAPMMEPDEIDEMETTITVGMYIADQNGKVNIRLTVDASSVIVKGFQNSPSFFKDKILGVQLHHRQVDSAADTSRSATPTNMSTGITMVIVIASVGGCCCVVLVILQLVMMHRRSQAKKMRPFISHRPSIQSLDHVALGVIPKSRPNSGYWNPAVEIHDELLENKKYSHLVNFFALANFCMDTTSIYEEFQSIPFETPGPGCVPIGDEDKNRFANVLPYKRTRVRLKKRPGDTSDYINANYITGYKPDQPAYIATQSPLVNTVEDFWRLVWEQQSRAILMLNPVMSTGKPKQSTCYWPDDFDYDSRREYGDYIVSLKKRQVHQDYIECTLEIMDIERNLKRELHHFWLTCWPDTGSLEPLTLVKFVLDTRPHYENSRASVIVHCGPGTGRTGTLVAVDTCMRMIEERRCADILNRVFKMRGERAGAVQTKEQYALIYQALNEYAVILSSPSISTRSSVITLHAML